MEFNVPIGNEVWGPWQGTPDYFEVRPALLTFPTVGQMESQDYAKTAYQWAKALKVLDPSIQLISCGGEFTCAREAWTFTQRNIRVGIFGLG